MYLVTSQTMPIVYSCIARGNVILADLAFRGGAFQETSLTLIRPLSPGFLYRKSILIEGFRYHILCEDRVAYVCVTELGFESKRAHHFLNEADASSQPSAPAKLDQVQGQVNEVKVILKDNINKVLERGEKLDDLIDKTDDLRSTADTFQRTSARVARKYWWKNTKIMIIIGVVVVIVVILIILFATGVIK
ncbi:vesicle-associated membrane protein 8 isoform X1 [Osmerus mordax]|uniref:vesicle-associated membrane protein 8 isoform X1 n=1 Tax=Osmerus mordax TaxID=8014 RepID=UPI00351067A8